MTRVLERIFLGMVAFVAIGFAAFNIWRIINETYQTLPAVDYIVSENITAKGVAIRDEIVLQGPQSDSLSYLYPDGTHVSMKMPVAQAVSSLEDITGRMKRDDAAKELENLRALASQGDTLILQAETIPQNVYTDIDTLAISAALGDLSPMQEMKHDIISQLNRRSLAADGDVDFQPRISELQARVDASGGVSDALENAITAPEPGYFTKEIDGLEGLLTIAALDKLSVGNLVEYINYAGGEEGPGGPGKIVSSHIWYFAVVVYGENVEKFGVGRKVELDFGLAGQPPFIARIDRIIEEDGNARAIVVFECVNMSESLINIRTHKVDISLNEMTGYRFPEECIRYEGDQMGVYVLKTTYIEFKPVQVLYEDGKDGMVVFRPNYIIPYKARLGTDGKPVIGTNGKPIIDSVGLERFDEVVIGGLGLRDGKPIKAKNANGPVIGGLEGRALAP